MSIDAEKRYHLIFTALQFSRNEQFLRKIRKQFALEIPFIDQEGLSETDREALDSYIYIEDGPDFSGVFSKLSRGYPQVGFTQIGVVRGSEILKLITTTSDDVRQTISVGDHYRITHGRYRNLHVQLDEIDGAEAVGVFDLLGAAKSVRVPTPHLERVEAPLDPKVAFRDLMSAEFDRGNRNVVIVDGSYTLHRAMYGNDKLYTKQKRFVGGCSGFYFEMLRLKELYSEFQVIVVFDGYDERKYLENPEYKATRAGGTERWQAAYADNLDWCLRLVKALGFHLVVAQESEGDDVVASLAVRLSAGLGYSRVIISAMDHDFYQVVDDRIELLIPKQSFRGHPSTIRVSEACEHFGVNRSDKINWARALSGDPSDNIPSVNQFYHKLTGVMTKYGKAHYLPIINGSDTLGACRDALKEDHRFLDFVVSGRFDDNVKLLTVRRDLFDGFQLSDFDRYREPFNSEVLEALLAEASFYKEIEMLPRVVRIFQSIW